MDEKDKIQELIDQRYKRVFDYPTPMRWDTEAHNTERLERYRIDEKTTSITLYDIPLEYVDKQGEVRKPHADKATFTLYKGEEMCTSFNLPIHPLVDFNLKMTYTNDGKEYTHFFNLKHLRYEQCGGDRHQIYMQDERDRHKSTLLWFTNETDAQNLNVFMYVILANNIFDEERKKHEARVNAPFERPSVGSGGGSGINNIFGSLFQINTSAAPSTPTTKEFKGDPYKELDGLIGLESIKNDIKELTNFIKIQQKRRKQGLSGVPVSLHLVFTGNPGTGKTTIARILAKIYKDIGVLSKGQVVEVDRAGLVAEYIGQTAPKTMKKINEAKGGILFIDEAYTLSKGDSKDFGQEAIDTILKAMEDNREDFIVIVAGYPDLMNDFINSNPGLQSRFNKYIEFPDYNAEEMFEIFQMMCKKYEYTLEDDAFECVKKILDDLIINKDERFANARTVRNLFETAITKQASRLSKGEYADEDMQILKKEDFDFT